MRSATPRSSPSLDGVNKKQKKKCKTNGVASWKRVVVTLIVAIGSIRIWRLVRNSLGQQFGFYLNHDYDQHGTGGLSSFTTLNAQQQQQQDNDEQEEGEDSCTRRKSDDDEKSSRRRRRPGATALCHRWSTRGGTASSLWMQHRNEILKASRHPLDEHGQHDAWMHALFDLVAAQPSSLQRAWKTLPPPHQVSHILDIVDKRMTYLSQQQEQQADDKPPSSHDARGRDDPPNDAPPPPPPPLRIAIFGGSVTEGAECEKLPNEIVSQAELYTNGTTFSNDQWPKIKGNACAWPYRWQRLLDHFLGPGVVQIHNLGVGGTSSLLAVPILKYWLYPPNSELIQQTSGVGNGGTSSSTTTSTGPDIILNSYAVNDNLFDWDPDANGTTSMDNFYFALDRTQQFVRTALLSKPCHEHAPILGFVSEYHGNLNELLLAEDIRADTVRLLSDYYQFSYISPASVVRPLVMVDSDETLVSPSWYKPRRKKNAPLERKKDGHFVMPGHVYTAWTMAYAVLSMVVDHCDDVMCDDMVEDDGDDFENDGQSSSAAVISAMNRFPPPLVTKDLLTIDRRSSSGAAIDDRSIPTKWRQEAVAAQHDEDEYCRTSSKTEAPCPFVFVATPTGTARTAVALNNYLRRFAVNPQGGGWRGENNMRYGWQNKIGLIANRPGAFLHLRVPNIKQKIRHVVIQSLYSYGEEWKDSEAQFNITVRDSVTNNRTTEEKTTSFTIKGYHDMEASITIPFTLDLGNKSAAIGQTVDVKITLIGGKTFKIISMMLCSR